MTEIKKQRWISLQEKQKRKADKEQKKIQDRAKLTNVVTSQGGVWCTEEEVEEHFQELNATKSDEEVRRAIYAQLNFHQRVLKSTAEAKEFFQMSKTVHGKSVKFTKTEMKNHLIQIVRHNNIDGLAHETTEAAAPRPVQYIDSTIQETSYASLKAKMAQKIEEGHAKRAVQQSKAYLQMLIDNPNLLKDKRVKHNCLVGGATKWYNAVVLDVVATSDNVRTKISKTKFKIRYEESELTEDEPLEEVFALLEDLKKK